jgi:hypothetical protein
MPAEHVTCVLGAARLEAAGWRQERPKEQLIAPYQPAGDRCSYTHVLALPLASASAPTMSFRKSANGASRAQPRATKTRFIPGVRARSRTRYASRNRLLARFRRAAPRICLLTAKPARPGPWHGAQRSTKARRSFLLPAWNTAWISLACLRRAVRGSPNFPTARLTAPSLDGEPLASLGAAPLENLPSTLRLHALAEPVCLRPSARVWLIRPLHGGTPSVERRTRVVY